MSVFGNTGGTGGSTSQGGGGLFGGGSTGLGGTGSTNMTQSGGLFSGGLGAKPASGGGLFGSSFSGGGGTGTNSGGSTSTPAASGSSALSGGLFGGGNTSNSSTPNPLLGGGIGSFSLPKPGDQNAAGGAKPAPSSFFSQPAASTSITTNSGGGLFGLPSKPAENTTSSTTGAGGLFSKPAENTGSTTTGGGLFGSVPKPAENTTSTTTGTGGLFGSAPKPAENAASTTTGTSGLFGSSKPAETGTLSATGTTPAASTGTGSLFSGGLFGKAPASGSLNFSLGGNNTAPPPAAPTGGLFGNLSSSMKPGEKTDNTTAAPSSLNFFEKKDVPSATKEGDKAKETTSSSLLPSTANAANTTSISNPVIAVPPPSMLRGKTIEEIVNRWSSELETHVREFTKFAGEVAVWDRALIENGNNLAALYSHVLAAERQQNEIDQSLDHIEQQQKDLASTLEAYEKVSQEILGGQGGGLRTLDTGPADTERDKNYMLATDLHTQLDDLSGSLTQMIDSVNALSVSQKSSDSGTEDPMTQIAQILSSHLESLQWIDGAVREVEGRVTDVEKRVKESGHSIPSSGPSKSRGFGLNR